MPAIKTLEKVKNYLKNNDWIVRSEIKEIKKVDFNSINKILDYLKEKDKVIEKTEDNVKKFKWKG